MDPWAPDFIRTRPRTAPETIRYALDKPVASVEASVPQYEPSLSDFTFAQTLGPIAHQEL